MHGHDLLYSFRDLCPTLESRQTQGEATMTLLPTPPVLLPTGELDENRAINRLADLIPMVRHWFEKEDNREFLETELRKGLREGRLPLTIYAVQAADAGDEICDAALRTVFAEWVGGMLPEQRPGHFQLRAYGQRAVLPLRPPHKRPQGPRWHDNWMRDIQVCMLIVLACREFGVLAEPSLTPCRPHPVGRQPRRRCASPQRHSSQRRNRAKSLVRSGGRPGARQRRYAPPGRKLHTSVTT